MQHMYKKILGKTKHVCVYVKSLKSHYFAVSMQLKVCAPCSFLFCSLLTEFARFQTHCGILVSYT